MYYPDLSQYEYQLDVKLHEVLNVGWLDETYPFPTGELKKETIEKLADILLIAGRVNQMRGFTECQICGEFYIWLEKGERRKLLGSAELWLPSASGLIYAAPTLIYHYIIEHSYLPPQEFLEAIEHFDFESGWNGDEIREKLINK